MTPPPTTPDPAGAPAADDAALVAALLDIERFVERAGWDQPARLFALVDTDQLVAAEPALAAELGLRGSAAGGVPGGLTSIEQDGFHAGDHLGETLATIAWPDTVVGCAVVVERTFLPAGAEADLPDDPDAAARYVARHPAHEEIRVVAGALREPAARQCVARLRSRPELLQGPDLVPGLAEAVAQTLVRAEEE